MQWSDPLIGQDAQGRHGQYRPRGDGGGLPGYLRATKAAVFLRMGLEVIGRPVVGPTAILGDNSAITELVNKEGASSRTRHFERTTVLIKYAVLQLIVVVHLIPARPCTATGTCAPPEGVNGLRRRRAGPVGVALGLPDPAPGRGAADRARGCTPDTLPCRAGCAGLRFRGRLTVRFRGVRVTYTGHCSRLHHLASR